MIGVPRAYARQLVILMLFIDDLGTVPSTPIDVTHPTRFPTGWADDAG